MGFSSGSSKAEREAKKQAIQAYYSALSQTERIAPTRKLNTQGARTVANAFEGDMSARSTRIARQADNVGRQLNQVAPQVDASANRFNKRLDEARRQMQGETVQRFKVTDRPTVNTLGGFAGVLQNAGVKAVGTFDDQASATQAAGSARAAHEAMPVHPFSVQPTDLTLGVSRMQPTEDQRTQGYIRDASLQPISQNYRTLPAAESAYNDLDKLGKAVTASASNTGYSNYSAQYEALADKLKTSLQRDARNTLPTQTPNPTGLLAGNMVINPALNPVQTA